MNRRGYLRGLKDERITAHVVRIESSMGVLVRLRDKKERVGMSEALRGRWYWRHCLCPRDFQVSMAGDGEECW